MPQLHDPRAPTTGVRLIQRLFIETPIGPMVAMASADALHVLEFANEDRTHRLDARRAHWFPPHRIVDGRNPVLDTTAAWLERYFGGANADPGGIPLEMHGTAFEQRVWRLLLEIPPGTTTSYGALSARLGLKNGARAVGLANGANPLAVIVPCHRVIGANGTLTGYGGGLPRKQWLLDHERRWSTALTLF